MMFTHAGFFFFFFWRGGGRGSERRVGRTLFQIATEGVLPHTYPCTHDKWQLWKLRASEYETHLETLWKWEAVKSLPTRRGRTAPPPSQQINPELVNISSPLYFLATLVNIVLHPVPEIFTMLICEYSIQLKIRVLNCSFSTQRGC